jgi:hypothetical protein
MMLGIVNGDGVLRHEIADFAAAYHFLPLISSPAQAHL